MPPVRRAWVSAWLPAASPLCACAVRPLGGCLPRPPPHPLLRSWLTGAFSVVFKGTYRGLAVAVKRQPLKGASTLDVK